MHSRNKGIKKRERTVETDRGYWTGGACVDERRTTFPINSCISRTEAQIQDRVVGVEGADCLVGGRSFGRGIRYRWCIDLERRVSVRNSEKLSEGKGEEMVMYLGLDNSPMIGFASRIQGDAGAEIWVKTGVIW
jgi:hypothetical protein